MKFRFSLRTLLVATTFACISVFLYVKYWPRPQAEGAPNLIVAVVDDKGDPVADATVSISDCRKGIFGLRYKTITDHSGTFQMKSVELSTLPRDYASATRISFGPFQEAFCYIEVEHDTHFVKTFPDYQPINLIKDFDYVFEYEMSLGGFVSGLVTNESGVPIANTRVRLVSKKGKSYGKVFTTDLAGRFITMPLSPESFDVYLSLSDIEQIKLLKKIDTWKLQWSQPREDFYKFGEVQIEAGETVELELQIPIWSKDIDSIRNSSKPGNSDLSSE